MSKKKQNKSYMKGGGESIEWTFGHILIALIIGLAIGGFFGYQTAGDATNGVATSGGLESTGPTDAYGRPPSHEHYGHSHN